MVVSYVNKNIIDSSEELIIHQVNCMGVMGSGVAKTIRDTYPKVYEEYSRMCNAANRKTLLGTFQIVRIGGIKNRYVCNLFGQYTFGYNASKRYTSYDAFDLAINRLVLWCIANDITSVAIPYEIGCGQAHANWSIIYAMICTAFSNTDIKITFYKFKEEDHVY